MDDTEELELLEANLERAFGAHRTGRLRELAKVLRANRRLAKVRASLWPPVKPDHGHACHATFLVLPREWSLAEILEAEQLRRPTPRPPHLVYKLFSLDVEE